jgi:FKBP-type peptidyl-prolyl cis-trans isomerase FklB
VIAHYHGTLIDGTVFDSSVERGEPATFPLNRVIEGWQEALTRMKVGDKWKVVIPPELGYGENGVGDAIGPNATLVFEVELLEVQKGE